MLTGDTRRPRRTASIDDLWLRDRAAQITPRGAGFGWSHGVPRVSTRPIHTGGKRCVQELTFGFHHLGPVAGCMLPQAALLGGQALDSHMPSLPPRFADRLCWLMASRRNKVDQRHYSNASLSRAIKANEKTVGNWLRPDSDPERTEPGAANLRSLCDEFDVSADFLLGRSEHECGLTSGMHLVDLDEYERFADGGEWAAEVPLRPAIVSEERLRELRTARKKRGGR